MSRSREFYEAVVNASQSATVVVDRDGTITFISQAGEELFGYTEAELVGRNIADFIDPDDLEEQLHNFGAVLDHDTRWPPAQVGIIGRDGRVVPAEVAGHGTFDEPVIGGAVYAVHRMDETSHLHQILAALSTGEPLGETLRLVTGMVAVPPLRLDAAVLYDPDESGTFASLAADDLPHGLSAVLREPHETAPWAGANVQPLTRADSPHLTMVEDLHPDLREALAFPYLECWVSPLVVDHGQVAGAIVVLSIETTLPGATVRQRVRRARDVCELAFVRRHHEDQLRHAALHDGLTSIPNRARFFDALEHGVGQRGGPLTGVLYLDLDGFKPLNDAHGHPFGDQVLIEVAARIDGALRPHDLAARLGGDEFGVLLEDLDDADEAQTVADRVLAAVQAPLCIDGVDAEVGASIGVAVGKSAGDRARLLHAADQAMYQAKRAGAGAVCLVLA